MFLLITCPYGTNGILNQELKFFGYKPVDCFETGSFLQADYKDILKLNLSSRIASKIYVQLLAGKVCQTFDHLFDAVSNCSREEYLPKNAQISISVVSKNSRLEALGSLQSVSHKAILTKLDQKGNQSEKKTEQVFDIFLHLENDQLGLYLNTSGKGLHERGYRTQAGEAPLKENLAAALVLMSGRSRKNTLWDPFCGSGTICIEAAMIARNIAPGLQRNFAFQSFMNYNQTQFEQVRQEHILASYPNNDYQIIGTDNDPNIIAIAQENAKRAGVADCITFRRKDILSSDKEEIIGNTKPVTIVTNPPYGKRLSPINLEELYNAVLNLASTINTQASIISSYPDFDHLIKNRRSRKEVRNGADTCFVRSKKR